MYGNYISVNIYYNYLGSAFNNIDKLKIVFVFFGKLTYQLSI